MALLLAVGFAAGAAAASLFRTTHNKLRQHVTTFTDPTSAALQPAHYVPSPHPQWSPGQPQPCPHDNADELVTLDPATYDKPSMYAFVISAVVPRPIAFISSISPNGAVNLSPYSYFNIMGHNPPHVAIGICRSPNRNMGKKDTLNNIEGTGEFVVNIMSEWFVEAANHTCGEYDPSVDEMQLAGLTPLASVMVRPPRVKEAAVHMECRLKHTYDTHDRSGAVTGAIVIAEVVLFHVSKAVTTTSPNTGKLVVDPVKLAPVSRLGGIAYGRTTELYNLRRPPGYQGQNQGQDQAKG